MEASPPWAELPADAVSEIAGHLHEATDFVRFHAVCRPWRQAPPPPHTPSFLPCLIEQTLFDDSNNLHLYSPFSGKLRRTRTSILAKLAGKKLMSSDAASGRVLAVAVHDHRKVVLINPLTGDATSLPPLPTSIFPIHVHGWRCPSGIVSNGSVMVHSSMSMQYLWAVVLLRPGETGWQEVDVSTSLKNMGFNSNQDLDEHMRRAISLCSSTGVLSGGTLAVARLPRAEPETSRYVLESLHGELLCLDFLGIRKAKAPELVSVTVHALGVRDDDGRPQWVKQREHGRGIDEHVCLFLNNDGSGFAIDAREFGGAEVTGGCAYFVDNHPEQTMRDAVWRYSFRDDTATVVDELPAGFGIRCMWYKPACPRISAVRSRLKRRTSYSQQPVRSRPRLQSPVCSQCAQ